VFATSSSYAANAFDKNTSCQTVAAAAGLGGTWVAWLSYGTTNAIDRVGAGPWYLMDGTTLAVTRAQLVAPPIAHEIDLTEMGQTLPTTKAAWTGTNADGTASGKDCDGWTTWNGTTTSRGTFGSTMMMDQAWTADTDETCAGTGFLRLYCFQD
jgi:hypothetical protein